MAVPTAINGIPIVDISAFTTDATSASAREKAAQDFTTKCRINGCVGITGHGISAPKLSDVFKLTKTLFDLPLADKMRAPHPDGPTPHRGYSGVGREQGAAKTATETADDAAKQHEYQTTTDYKESYEIGSEDNRVQYNIWLPEDVLPGFRRDALAFFWDMASLADRILDCIALGLQLSEVETAQLKGLHTGHDDQLRLLHYPAMDTARVDRQKSSRMGAHTDWSLFTLLFQSGRGGLQFLDRASDEFMSATPSGDVVYLNIGDMLMRISNGILPSALHRVTAETVASSDATNPSVPPRYSVPFFVVPTGDGLIAPPQSLITQEGRTNFEPVTFNTYSEKMFNIINIG